MISSYLPSSYSIAQITWPTKQISAYLCDRCNHSIDLDSQSIDFQEILARVRSGYSPTDSERVSYLGTLEETRRELERREEELHRLREATRRLEEQQKLLQAYEAAIKHILSPIQRLPLEVLGEILQHVCCGNDATDTANNYKYRQYYYEDELNQRLPSFDVSGVCFKWYKFVTSMPMLWTSFGIDRFGYVSESLVETFLERSCSNLVDFKLSHMLSDEFCDYPSPLVDHCNRWRHVSIVGVLNFMFDAFLNPLVQNGETPTNLISLYLNTKGFQYLKIPFIFPNLQSLTLRGFILDFDHPQYTVTTICLAKVSPEDASMFLVHFPNIKSLKLEQIKLNDDSPNSAPIVFDRTEKLTLVYPVDNDFLTATKFPCLTDLCLCDSRRLEASEFQTVLSFISQSYCALTHLGINCVAFSYEELLQIFRLVPSLTHLDAGEPLNMLWRSQTMAWILEILASPLPLGLQEGNNLSEALPVDGDIDSIPSDDNGHDTHEDSGSEQEEYNRYDYCSDEDDYPPHSRQDHADIKEPLLPRLVELNLSLKPRHRALLLDVVRSRRPTPETGLGNSPNRTCLRTLRVRYGQSHIRNRSIPKQFKALSKSLMPFKGKGLEIYVEIPEFVNTEPRDPEGFLASPYM
ncbi:hypothetical protein F5878DRAFT_724161 [Lentinula raphanica]|uniref:F-box domain-containing protein n=1 Tax=Lentinula raphanica TaxID=153919 RepID=A0AA38PBL1_9AGAR|nr:hypothetical protein F5878DRAFT_724161 [Lentinula raphanica]